MVRDSPRYTEIDRGGQIVLGGQIFSEIVLNS